MEAFRGRESIAARTIGDARVADTDAKERIAFADAALALAGHHVTDPAKLQRLEEGAAAIRLVELAEHPIEGRFDDEHMKAIHSFREGITRSQFVFFSQLAEQSGWRLHPSRFAPGTPGRDEFVAARFYSQATGHNARLAAMLGRAIVPL